MPIASLQQQARQAAWVWLGGVEWGALLVLACRRPRSSLSSIRMQCGWDVWDAGCESPALKRCCVSARESERVFAEAGFTSRLDLFWAGVDGV